VDLALPNDVLAVDGSSVSVRVTIRAVSATRDYSAGVVLAGARADRQYELAVNSVLVTVGGSVVDLDRLDGAAFTVSANVAGLDVGEHEVPIAVNLPVGLSLHAVSPPRVAVTIRAAPAVSPSPGPDVQPSPAASG
jgi:YbbR domain-containing protein